MPGCGARTVGRRREGGSRGGAGASIDVAREVPGASGATLFQHNVTPGPRAPSASAGSSAAPTNRGISEGHPPRSLVILIIPHFMAATPAISRPLRGVLPRLRITLAAARRCGRDRDRVNGFNLISGPLSRAGRERRHGG